MNNFNTREFVLPTPFSLFFFWLYSEVTVRARLTRRNWEARSRWCQMPTALFRQTNRENTEQQMHMPGASKGQGANLEWKWRLSLWPPNNRTPQGCLSISAVARSSSNSFMPADKVLESFVRAIYWNFGILIETLIIGASDTFNCSNHADCSAAKWPS